MALSSSTLASIIIGATAITGSAAAFAINSVPAQITSDQQSNKIQVQDPAQENLPDEATKIMPPRVLPNPTNSADPLNPPIVPPTPDFSGGNDDDEDYQDSDDEMYYDDFDHMQHQDDDDSEYEGDDD